jgi:ATP-dependent phosphofructokinase / diphosphate-dependent phosphofructokinase
MSGGTLVVGQSGGATAVINASLVGVVEGGRAAGFGRVLGMRHGIEGLLGDDLIDLGSQPQAVLDLVRQTPSAALGTGRYKLGQGDLERALAVLRRHDAHALVYIGGNDSADTAHRLHLAARAAGLDLAVLAVPKTIDNDLPATDHCPGYPSLARFLANAVRDATYDTFAAPGLYPVKAIEVQGRDAGWVAATGALGFGPDEADLLPLLCLPERPFPDVDALLAAIEDQVAARGWTVVVIPETLRDAAGRHLGGEEPEYVDAFGHPYHASPGAAIVRAVTTRLGLRARFDKPGTIARMSGALASPIDRDEAYELGRAAAERAAAGESDLMLVLRRERNGPYAWHVDVAPLVEVANTVRYLPDEFIGADGVSISDAFRRYALPLLGVAPFPRYGRLQGQSPAPATWRQAPSTEP